MPQPQPSHITVTVDMNDRITIIPFVGEAHRILPNPGESADVVAASPGDTFEQALSSSHGDSRLIAIFGVAEAYVQKDRRELVQVYGGQSRPCVVTHGEIFNMLLLENIFAILPPRNFHRSRRGGRIVVRRDGVEIALLDLYASRHSLDRPTWEGNCWDERYSNIVSEHHDPLPGTNEYHRRYYQRTEGAKRKSKRAAKREENLRRVEELQKAQTAPVAELKPQSSIEEILAELQNNKPDGGGGPFPWEERVCTCIFDAGLRIELNVACPIHGGEIEEEKIDETKTRTSHE